MSKNEKIYFGIGTLIAIIINQTITSIFHPDITTIFITGFLLGGICSMLGLEYGQYKDERKNK